MSPMEFQKNQISLKKSSQFGLAVWPAIANILMSEELYSIEN